MKRYLLLAALCVLARLSAFADTIQFSYTGTGVEASGFLSATEIAPGEYLITGITGERNGKTITSFVELPSGNTPGTVFHYQDTVENNLIFLPSSTYFGPTWENGFVFGTADGEFNPYFNTGDGNLHEYVVNSYALDPANIPGTQITFSAQVVPEPATYSMVGSGLLGLLALVLRKRAA